MLTVRYESDIISISQNVRIFKGLPGVVLGSAKKILDVNPTWEVVVEQFKKKEMTEDDVLRYNRV